MVKEFYILLVIQVFFGLMLMYGLYDLFMQMAFGLNCCVIPYELAITTSGVGTICVMNRLKDIEYETTQG